MTGSPYWWVRWYSDAPDGRRILKRMSTAHTSTGPLEIARHTRQEAQELINGAAGIQEASPKERSCKFGAVWALEYITERIEYEGKSRKTTKWYRDALEKFSGCFGQDFSLVGLKVADVWTYQKYTLDSGCKPATVNTYCRAIRALITRIVRQGMLDRNPLAGFERIREPHIKRHLSLDELRRLLSVLEAHPDDPVARLVRILIFTGIRRGEVLLIERSDVDIPGERFLSGNIKSHECRKRWIAIPPAVISDFEFFISSQPDNPAPFAICHPDTLTHRTKRFLKEVGLPEYHCHSLRHTFTTLALEHGASIRDLQRHLDHSSVTVTEIYAHEGTGKGVFDIGV
jgi:integrase